jgi:hypothetical protein
VPTKRVDGLCELIIRPGRRDRAARAGDEIVLNRDVFGEA